MLSRDHLDQNEHTVLMSSRTKPPTWKKVTRVEYREIRLIGTCTCWVQASIGKTWLWGGLDMLNTVETCQGFLKLLSLIAFFCQKTFQVQLIFPFQNGRYVHKFPLMIYDHSGCCEEVSKKECYHWRYRNSSCLYLSVIAFQIQIILLFPTWI